MATSASFSPPFSYTVLSLRITLLNNMHFCYFFSSEWHQTRHTQVVLFVLRSIDSSLVSISATRPFLLSHPPSFSPLKLSFDLQFPLTWSFLFPPYLLLGSSFLFAFFYYGRNSTFCFPSFFLFGHIEVSALRSYLFFPSSLFSPFSFPFPVLFLCFKERS